MSALTDAIADLAARTSATLTITQYVDLLGGPGRGGGTAKAAAGLGISQREVQRYLKFERGESGQVRKPQEVRIKGVAPDVVRRRMERDGVTVEHIDYLDDYDERPRSVHKHVAIPPEDVRTALRSEDAQQDGVFGGAFTKAYYIGGHSADVSSVGAITLSFAG